jgi:hypothetical protein
MNEAVTGDVTISVEGYIVQKENAGLNGCCVLRPALFASGAGLFMSVQIVSLSKMLISFDISIN